MELTVRSNHTKKHAGSANHREMLVLGMIGIAAGMLPLFVKPAIALACMGGLCVVIAILRNPVIGFYLIAATIPLEVAGRIGNLTANLPLTLPKILTLLTLVSWLLHWALRRVRFRQMPWMHLLTLFWLWTLVTLIGAEELSAGYEAVFRLATTVIFFFLIVQIAKNSTIIKRALVLFMLVATVAAGYSVVERYMPGETFQFRHGWEENEARRFGVEKDIVEKHMVGIVKRSSGLSVHSIILSLNVALLIPILASFFANTNIKSPLRLVWLAILAILLTATILSFARTGFILLLFAFAMILLKKVIRLTPSVVLTVLLAVFIAGILAPKKYFERVLSPEIYTLKSRSISTRLEAQKGALKQFLAHPLFGEGFGNRYGIFKYYTTYPDKKHAVTPHNAYIHVAALTGIPGIALLLLFFYKILRNLQKTVKNLRDRGLESDATLAQALHVSILTFLLSGLALDLFDKGMPQAWLLIGMAAAFVYNTEVADSKQKSTALSGGNQAP